MPALSSQQPSRQLSLSPPPDSQDSQAEDDITMSARVLRKGKARARVVDDDEDSDADFEAEQIKRKCLSSERCPTV